MTDLLAHFEAARQRVPSGQEACGCCGGSGEHVPEGHECYRCDASGSVSRGSKEPYCDGQRQPRRRHWRQKTAAVTINYAHNTEPAPDMGEMYAQHVEPNGRYLVEREPGDTFEQDPRWETGSITFQNPLHMPFGGGYREESNWKHQLSRQFGGRRGRALSYDVAKAGHDGIITHDEDGSTREIVDLTHLHQHRQAAAQVMHMFAWAPGNARTAAELFHGSDNPEPFERFDFSRKSLKHLDQDEESRRIGEEAPENRWWNSRLGSHFTSEHSMAAEAARSSGEGHIYHVDVRMNYPKDYPSEHDLAREGFQWARRTGYKGLVNYTGEADALQQHPQAQEIAEGFRRHLQSQGHDGVTYGNEYEQPIGHRCAIIFHPDQAHITETHGAYAPCRYDPPDDDDEHTAAKTASEVGDYGMEMRPDEEGDPLHAMGSRDWPNDFYDRIHEYDFSHGEHGYKHLNDIRRARGNPEKMVTVYRAAPALNPESRNNKKGEINHGDWVTLNRSYAAEDARGVNERSEKSWKGPNDPGRSHIWSARVPAKHVRSAGNDLMEWGYWGEDKKDLPHVSERCSHRNPYIKRERSAPRRSFWDTDFAGKSHYGARQQEGDERPHGDYTMRYRTEDQGERKPRHIIETFTPGNARVGELNWYGTTGVIHHLNVADDADGTNARENWGDGQDHRRKGIATAMWNWGQEMSPSPKHSGDRTPQGAEWAKSVRGPGLRRHRGAHEECADHPGEHAGGTDAAGHRVHWDPGDSWHHLDGSVSEEDGTCVTDHPIHTDDSQVRVAVGTMYRAAAVPEYGPRPERDWEDIQKLEEPHRSRAVDQMFDEDHRWKQHIQRGLSLGHLDSDQAKSYGYHPSGHATESGTGRSLWQPLPQHMYHVTTDLAGVREHGLKTRSELSQIRGGHGLGGGEDDTISMTTNRELGGHILNALHEFHRVVNGKFTPAQMWDQAKRGYGAKRPYHEAIAGYWKSGWKEGDELPDGLRRAIEGTHRWNTMGSDQETMDKANGPGTRPAKGDEGWMSGHDPPKKMHAYWERDMKPDERRDNAADFYKHFAIHRQMAGGPEDPMFFSTDTKSFAAKDPKNFALLHVRPRPGAQGYPLSGMHEWRTGTGDALEVHHYARQRSGELHEAAGRMLDLYHHTGPESARKIMKTKAWETKPGVDDFDPRLYFSDRPHEEASRHGPVAIHVRVPESLAEVDDEFPSGETHYTVPLERASHIKVIGLDPKEAAAAFNWSGLTHGRYDVPTEAVHALRQHEQRNSGKYPGLAGEVAERGIEDPLEVSLHDDGRVVLRGGSHRVNIARDLGHPTVPVQVVDMRTRHEAARGETPLPVQRGLYYRLHGRDEPFGPEHAVTRNIGEPPHPDLAKYWEPKSGYSAFWHPHHLHQYLSEMSWNDPQELRDSRVVAFKGTPVGEGADGEPRVMPESGAHESMSWRHFQHRLEITPESQSHWDHHTWGEDSEGRRVDDGYRTIGEIGKEGATDWDQSHAKIPEEIHRGLYAPESHGVFSMPMSDEDIAHGLIRAHQEEHYPYERDQHRLFGTHWTSDEGVARNFAKEHERNHFEDDQCPDHDEHFEATPVVFHAQRPQRHEIEDDPRRLGWQNVDDYTDPEHEVPIRHGAPVRIKGVSWLTHTGLGPMWHRHDLREPVELRAEDRDSPDDPNQWNASLHTGAVFMPTERIFGPTTCLDKDLFDGDKLKPQVRDTLLARLDSALAPVLGSNWEDVASVHLAGSQVSLWTDADCRGNGDLDTLIGIAYTHARNRIPEWAQLTDEAIDKLLNAHLREHYNADHWHPAFAPGGREFDLTGYVNAGAIDIRKLNPYAAWDLLHDDWTVRPPELPAWSPESFPQGPALWQEARGLIAQVRAILRLPEPFRTQEAKRIWNYIHEGRRAEFSEEGMGWLGTGNVLEKALDQASGGLVGKLKAVVYGHDTGPQALGHGMTTADLAGAHG